MRINNVTWQEHGFAQGVMCIGIMLHTIVHWRTSAKYGMFTLLDGHPTNNIQLISK
jgi:hypothetical protein